MGNALQTPPRIPPQKQQQPPNDDENPQIFTCEICIEPTEKKFRNGDNGCSHPFCTDCVVKYIHAKLEDNVGRIKCPSLTCDRTLSPRACESLVGPSVFVRWCDVLCEEAIGGLERCYCPNVKCSALIVNECSGTAKKSKCPDCKKLFCFKCKRVWHAGGCEENREMRDWNDVAFERLAEERKWTRCPRCRHFVDLVDGCSNVECRCGISFCYMCGNQVNRCGCYGAAEGFFRRCANYCILIGVVILYIGVLILYFGVLFLLACSLYTSIRAILARLLF